MSRVVSAFIWFVLLRSVVVIGVMVFYPYYLVYKNNQQKEIRIELAFENNDILSAKQLRGVLEKCGADYDENVAGKIRIVYEPPENVEFVNREKSDYCRHEKCAKAMAMYNSLKAGADIFYVDYTYSAQTTEGVSAPFMDDVVLETTEYSVGGLGLKQKES